MKERIISWLRELLGYYELEKVIDDKNKSIKQLRTELEQQDSKYKDKQEKLLSTLEELDETKEQLNTANEEIFYLTDFIDIDNFKAWYISRRGSQTWNYDWDNKGSKDVSKAFRYEDPETGPIKLVQLANKITDLYNLYDIDSLSKTDIIGRVKQYFTRRNEWTYVFDKDNSLHPGVTDYWQEIDISIDRRRGDCEDLAILMHMIIRTMFDLFGYSEYKWRLVFTAGRMVGYGGHGYNLYLHDDGHYYVIESTYDLEGSFKRTWLKTPVVYNNLYRDFWGFATPEKSWRNWSYAQNFEALVKKQQ